MQRLIDLRNCAATLILVVSLEAPAVAQAGASSDQQARQAYARAGEAAERGEHRAALEAAEEAVRLLGRTNVRLQPLIVRSLVALGEWKAADAAAETYFTLPGADPALAEHAEMTAARSRIGRELAQLKAQEQQRIDQEHERRLAIGRAEALAHERQIQAEEQRQREEQEQAAAEARARERARDRRIVDLQRQHDQLSVRTAEEKFELFRGVAVSAFGVAMLGTSPVLFAKSSNDAWGYWALGTGALATGIGVATLFFVYPGLRNKREDELRRVRLQLDQLTVSAQGFFTGARIAF